MSATVPDRLQGHTFPTYASAGRETAPLLAAPLQASGIPVLIGRADIQNATSWRQQR